MNEITKLHFYIYRLHWHSAPLLSCHPCPRSPTNNWICCHELRQLVFEPEPISAAFGLWRMRATVLLQPNAENCHTACKRFECSEAAAPASAISICVRSFEIGSTAKWAARRTHRLHLGPLHGVLDAHVISHRVRMGESPATLQHRTYRAVARIVPVQMLAKQARLERCIAQRTRQEVAGRHGRLEHFGQFVRCGGGVPWAWRCRRRQQYGRGQQMRALLISYAFLIIEQLILFGCARWARCDRRGREAVVVVVRFFFDGGIAGRCGCRWDVHRLCGTIVWSTSDISSGNAQLIFVGDFGGNWISFRFDLAKCGKWKEFEFFEQTKNVCQIITKKSEKQ